MTKSDFFSRLFLISCILKGTFVFLWTARQYHSLCMLGLGFVASWVIIRVIGKFKISVAIPKLRMLPPSLIFMSDGHQDQGWFQNVLCEVSKCNSWRSSSKICCWVDSTWNNDTFPWFMPLPPPPPQRVVSGAVVRD